jgi:hypothetical protein
MEENQKAAIGRGESDSHEYLSENTSFPQLEAISPIGKIRYIIRFVKVLIFP